MQEFMTISLVMVLFFFLYIYKSNGTILKKEKEEISRVESGN